MEAVLKLKSVLCDPEGMACIQGSAADRAIIDSALSEIEAENAALAGTKLYPRPAPRVVELEGIIRHASQVKALDDNLIAELEAQIAALLVAIEAKQKALKMVEWEEYDDPDWGMQVFCPSCRMEKKHGHYECRLAEALSISPSAELLEARDRNLIADFIHEFKRHVGGDGEFWLHELEDFAELGEVR